MSNYQSVQAVQTATRKNSGGIRLRACCAVSPAGSPGNVSPSRSLHCLYKFFNQHTLPNVFTLLPYILLIQLLFTSCNTFSPVSTGGGQPEVFSSIENVEPVWLTFAEGIGYFHGKVSSPKIEFYALKIDLASPDVRVVVRGGAVSDNGGTSSEVSRGTLSTRVTSFVRDNNLLAGINALPFDIVSAKEKQPVKNVGIVISEGALISPANPRYDAIVFYKSENSNSTRAAIVNQSSIRSTENIQNAVGGFYQILADGAVTKRIDVIFRSQNDTAHSANTARHPRSAAGISPNGQYLYLLVIDGRRALSIGATEPETAFLTRALGCRDAINLDGGGSSALALRHPNGRVRAVNTPIHGGIPNLERAVAGCLGVNLSTEK